MRFLHTADWQVGMRATQLGDKGERVRQARSEAARRVVEMAHREKVDFVLVAGDTFEHNGVERLKVREVAKILGSAGCPVYILPGNHDPLTPGSVWEDSSWSAWPNLHLLTQSAPVEVCGAVLYPCPVLFGDSREDPTAWIRSDGSAVAIGVAHGSVENAAYDQTQAQRTAILELSAKGVSKREIAQVMRLSRPTVRKVLRENSSNVPEIQRAEKAEPYREQILELLTSCKGNLVRVHEELVAGGAVLSYPALTGFCRRQGIGQTPAVPAGQYHFEPGVEMQHDTSPHTVEVGGRKYKAQTASAVLCYSHMLFFQINPTFQRFDCKVFLTDALRHTGGVVERVMIDNTHVVVLRGTGREMIPVPEMEAFAERFGFRFVAHAIGNANRSARVERPLSAQFLVMHS